jgi:hypothetical protein
MNPKVTSAIGIGLGFLGVVAWIWLVPYSSLTAEEWGVALVLLCLAALILVITISSAVLIDSYWTRFAPALRLLRPVSAMGVVVGAVAAVEWFSWVTTPPCMSTMPIAAGVCPPVPNATEAWAVLIALTLMVGISLFVLAKSFRRQTPQPPPQAQAN